MNKIGRRGFLGMLAGALGAVGLDAVPGLARAADALEDAHKRATIVSLAVRKVSVVGPVRDLLVSLLTNYRMSRPDTRRHVFCANVSAAMYSTVSIPDGLLIEEGGALEVAVRPLHEDVWWPALYVRNIRGRLVVEQRRPGVTVEIVKYVVTASPSARIHYSLEWAES